MDFKKIAANKLEKVAGGSQEEYYNTCKECGKQWDMRAYGYGSAVMPNWVTGPWCPECRKKQQEEFLKKAKEKNDTKA